MTPEPDHYFDYAAACPVRPEIAALYPEYCRKFAANPHATTCFSHECRRAIEESAANLLAFLNIPERDAEVIWCSGATEALNLAICGCHPRTSPKMYFDPTAHPAMLEAARRRAAATGTALDFLPVNSDGSYAKPNILESLPGPLIGLCHVNNETGVIHRPEEFPLAPPESTICLDASQSLGRIDIPWKHPRISFIAASARKIGGPPGLGMLIKRRTTALSPLLVGGSQQNGLRAGTLDTVAIALLTPTLALLKAERERENQRLIRLNEYLRQEITNATNGHCRFVSPDNGVPAILSVALPGYDAGVLVRIMAADYGFQVSSGSACQAESPAPSHVLTAMGFCEPEARSVLRLSLGYASTESGITALAASLALALKNY